MDINNPVFSKPSDERKYNIIKLRLQGLSSSQIASETNLSRNYVSNILKYFRFGKSDDDYSKKFKKPLPEESIKPLAAACTEKILYGTGDRILSSRYELPVPMLHTAYHVLSDKHKAFSNKKNELAFPEIEKWRRSKNLSVKKMSERCKCSLFILKSTLSGKRPLTPDVARALTSVTGIPVSMPDTDSDAS